MSRRPQFEVLDPVVQPVPVSMMNHFVWQKGAAEVECHHQPVLTYLGGTSNQASKRRGDWDLAIAMAEIPVAGALADRTIRLGIAGGQDSLVVRGAKVFGLVGPVTIIKRTESFANPQRLLGWRSSPQQPQVMAVAITLRLGVPVAIRRRARGM